MPTAIKVNKPKPTRKSLPATVTGRVGRFTSQFETTKKQSFPKEKDFQDFLKQSGMTLADAKFQVRFNTVYRELREKAVKNATKVTDKSVEDFYNKNKARFAQPERRDLRIVLAKEKARAEAAKKALDGQRDVFVQSLATGRPVAPWTASR
mgnify:CR=1 FL=1